MGSRCLAGNGSKSRFSIGSLGGLITTLPLLEKPIPGTFSKSSWVIKDLTSSRKLNSPSPSTTKSISGSETTSSGNIVGCGPPIQIGTELRFLTSLAIFKALGYSKVVALIPTMIGLFLSILGTTFSGERKLQSTILTLIPFFSKIAAT